MQADPSQGFAIEAQTDIIFSAVRRSAKAAEFSLVLKLLRSIPWPTRRSWQAFVAATCRMPVSGES